MSNSPILVTGATGRIGRHLVDTLASKAVPVTAMTRDPDRASGLAERGVDLVEGDFSDPASLENALAGVSKAFLLSPVLQEMADYQTNFIEAAEQADVTQLVKLSAAGADPESKWDIARWHGEVERRLTESDIHHTHLRPVFYMQNLLDAAETLRETGVFERPAPPDTRINMIDTRDVAAVAATTLTEQGHYDTAYKLTGRRPVRLTEVTETLSRVIGREITYQEISPTEATEVFVSQGAPDWLAHEQAALFQGFAKGAGDVTTDAVRKLLGRQPRTLQEFADEYAAELRAQ